MSELRSLLDQLSAVDIGQMSVEMLDEDIDELVYGRQMMDVLLAQRVRGMTDRGGHVELGYPSPTAYLTGKGMSAGRARRHVIRAYASDSAPGTSKAWTDGRLSTDQAELLIRMAAAVPDQFPEAEDRLVEIVEPLSVASTAKAVEYWRQSVDGRAISRWSHNTSDVASPCPRPSGGSDGSTDGWPQLPVKHWRPLSTP